MRLIVAVLAALPLAACVTVPPVTPITDSRPVPLSSQQVATIKATVSRDFFDPSAAQFRNIRAADVTLKTGEQARRVCGQVNGKNRMGGYVGFNYFGGTMRNGAFAQEPFFGPCEKF